MTDNQSLQIQGTVAVLDQRKVAFSGLFRDLTTGPIVNLEGILSDSGNIYIRGAVPKAEAERLAKDYFAEQGEFYIPELLKVVPAASVQIKFTRRFDDGVVQFAGFGEEWTSKPGYCWAIYGHVTSELRPDGIQELPSPDK
ncbi:MAG TPA: hypothetical protein VJJ52_04425 [Candidatus Nanoarchaeia archaeon]|nr:hypothetical protein [Candidatus Nanoarchaeia archaeon]